MLIDHFYFSELMLDWSIEMEQSGFRDRSRCVSSVDRRTAPFRIPGYKINIIRELFHDKLKKKNNIRSL